MRRLLGIGGICLLSTACGGPEAADGDVEEYVDAGHIRFYFPPDKPVCAGTATFLNDMLNRLADYLGLPVPERIDYHYHPDPDLSQVCGTAVSYAGCSFPGEKRVWVRDATSVHEIVHALADQDGEHYSFLAEGLATALGDQNVWLTDYDAEESTYLTSESFDPSKNGGLAGDLVSYLLVEFGASRFMDLYARVSPRATSQAFKDEFKLVYGLDFDEVLAQRRAATSRFKENRLRFPECSLPLLDWDGDLWSATNEVDCDTSGIGPSTRLALPATAWLGQTLQIGEEGTFAINFSGTSGGAGLYRCDPPQERWSLTAPSQPFLGDALGENSLTFGRLGAGRYAVLTNSDSRDQPASVSVTISPSAPMQTSCVEQAPILVPNDVDGIYLLSEPDVASVRTFELEAPRTATGQFSQAQLCDAQCGACRMIPQFDALSLEAGVTYSLRVGSYPYRRAYGIQLSPH